MKTKVHKNSLEAYNYLNEKKILRGRKLQIYSLLSNGEYLTNHEIGVRLKLPDHCVTGRTNTLKEWKLLEEKYTVPSPFGGKTPVSKLGLVQRVKKPAPVYEEKPIETVRKAKAWDDYNQCPECNGSKRKKIYRTNSGDCREVVCDYCDGAGYI